MAFKRDSITSKTFEERGGSLEEAGETFFRQFLPPPSKELYDALKLLFGVHSGLELARDAEGKHIVGVKGDFFAGLGALFMIPSMASSTFLACCCFMSDWAQIDLAISALVTVLLMVSSPGSRCASDIFWCGPSGTYRLRGRRNRRCGRTAVVCRTVLRLCPIWVRISIPLFRYRHKMTLFFVQCVEKSLRWGNIFFYLFVKVCINWYYYLIYWFYY